MRGKLRLLDCTLRDGGYYNNWDFDADLVRAYLSAMAALNVRYVEIGMRSLKNDRFRGGFFYSTDAFLTNLGIPFALDGKIAVMVNASELLSTEGGVISALECLFDDSANSPVSLVRIACQYDELPHVLEASFWLKKRGYKVAYNVMGASYLKVEEVASVSSMMKGFPVDVLYIADSMGSLNASQIEGIIKIIRTSWSGEIGVHMHDNMSQAVTNSVVAVAQGATWVDGTVTGMGRGAGNAQTEYLVISLEGRFDLKGNPTKLFQLVSRYFKPMQRKYLWGTNPYFYLAGKFGIHPSFVQQMLSDRRYGDEDILAVIEFLRKTGGRVFNLSQLEIARKFYSGKPCGNWKPEKLVSGRDVLIVGTGPGVERYRSAIEEFIVDNKPYVIALNTQKSIDEDLVDARAACHPIRVLADYQEYGLLKKPLIAPFSMLTRSVLQGFKGDDILDFGLSVEGDTFEFFDTFAKLPSSLAMGYAFSIATSGKAKRIFLAGFDGWQVGDVRNNESEELIKSYNNSKGCLELISITPTIYNVKTMSIYGSVGIYEKS